mmetsp:Transcript_21941/g.53918  ORF Transcript_21941/g.53918 Transcript_21941/m.53918 type:complete len:293 (+) Transcript_21941:1707-2585(+)
MAHESCVHCCNRADAPDAAGYYRKGGARPRSADAGAEQQGTSDRDSSCLRGRRHRCHHLCLPPMVDFRGAAYSSAQAVAAPRSGALCTGGRHPVGGTGSRSLRVQVLCPFVLDLHCVILVGESQRPPGPPPHAPRRSRLSPRHRPPKWQAQLADHVRGGMLPLAQPGELDSKHGRHLREHHHRPQPVQAAAVVRRHHAPNETAELYLGDDSRGRQRHRSAFRHLRWRRGDPEPHTQLLTTANPAGDAGYFNAWWAEPDKVPFTFHDDGCHRARRCNPLRGYTHRRVCQPVVA